jgi:hypothetical protein
MRRLRSDIWKWKGNNRSLTNHLPGQDVFGEDRVRGGRYRLPGVGVGRGRRDRVPAICLDVNARVSVKLGGESTASARAAPDRRCDNGGDVDHGWAGGGAGADREHSVRHRLLHGGAAVEILTSGVLAVAGQVRRLGTRPFRSPASGRSKDAAGSRSMRSHQSIAAP